MSGVPRGERTRRARASDARREYRRHGARADGDGVEHGDGDGVCREYRRHGARAVGDGVEHGDGDGVCLADGDAQRLDVTDVRRSRYRPRERVTARVRRDYASTKKSDLFAVICAEFLMGDEARLRVSTKESKAPHDPPLLHDAFWRAQKMRCHLGRSGISIGDDHT